MFFVKIDELFPEKFKFISAHNVKESEKKIILDLSLYSDQHQKLKGSVLDPDTSSIQVSWKYVQ